MHTCTQHCARINCKVHCFSYGKGCKTCLLPPMKARSHVEIEDIEDSRQEFLSEIKDSSQDFLSEIEDSRQEFPSEIEDIEDSRQEFLSEIMDSRQEFLSEIECSRQDFTSKTKDSSQEFFPEIEDSQQGLQGIKVKGIRVKGHNENPTEIQRKSNANPTILDFARYLLP